MKAIDTNVLVRLLTRDDPSQAAVAAAEVGSGTVFLAATVLLETEWVLRHAYGYARDQVNGALRGVVNLDNAVVQAEPAVRAALEWHGEGMDFADALHLASARQADELVTFDRRFSSLAGRVAGRNTVRLLQ